MDIQTLIGAFISFLNTSVVPLIFAVAFIVFLWNAFQFFIVKGASDEGREKAKRLMVWGILAFVLMVSIWGIVNMLVTDLGFGQEGALCPDSVPNCNGQFGP